MSKYHAECANPNHKRNKKKEAKPETVTPVPKEDASDLLAVLNPNRACSCEVTARAVSADVPKYLGLSNRRAALEEPTDSELILDPDPESSTDKNPKDPSNPESTKKTDSKSKLCK